MALSSATVPDLETAPPIHRLVIVRRGADAVYDELSVRWRYDPGTLVLYDRRRGPSEGGAAPERRQCEESAILTKRGFYVQRLMHPSRTSQR